MAVPMSKLLSVLSFAVKVASPERVDLTVKATTPEALEVVPATAVILSEAPRLEVRATVLPETGLLFMSSRVTVTVEVVEPSATSEVGERVTLEALTFTAPTVKVTAAVAVTVTESVVSIPVKVAIPAKVDFAVKATTPEAFEVVPATAVMLSDPPLLEVSETVLPWTRLSFTSFKVTVMVEVVLPSAATEEGEAATREWSALTAPGVKVTAAVEVKVIVSVVSVAVKVAIPAWVDLAVKVTTPLALEEPELGAIVSVPPRLELRETVFPETGLLLESSKVTVIVEVVVPSATNDEGEAATVETEALTPAADTAIEVAVQAVVSAWEEFTALR
jgi:hypothetical protein